MIDDIRKAIISSFNGITGTPYNYVYDDENTNQWVPESWTAGSPILFVTNTNEDMEPQDGDSFGYYTSNVTFNIKIRLPANTDIGRELDDAFNDLKRLFESGLDGSFGDAGMINYYIQSANKVYRKSKNYPGEIDIAILVLYRQKRDNPT